MDSGMFRGLDAILVVLVALAVLGITLGLWKLVELIMWVARHLHWVST